MTLQVVLQSEAGDAFLLEGGADGPTYIYDRLARTVADVAEPATLIGRAEWRDFSGDAGKILAEATAIRKDLNAV